ncbi:hypothetical protein PUN71_015590 [Arthrobacter sp. NQ7]|uniref:hypothetical protein n=1 Tax=Arthrobacter sp. NQ7 TaxID=3032303 RepID=UPI00241023F9|nr:hypothetical protein [Arthrobacter sp. NQ7]MDJ0458627.1 hypothetical protein [Arthrobacter sp. NQ7]
MEQTQAEAPLTSLNFDSPYVDIDEWRDVPVRHRYVHGGFEGTETRFSVYFPPAEDYEGRFFQHITPVPDSEHLGQSSAGREDKIGFSFASGAYFVETNGGGPGFAAPGADPTIYAFRANAAAADYSREVAVGIYGDHRPFGYAYGGSGGGFRTIGGAENTTGVWDGFVPYVIGSPMAIPNVFAVRMHAQRVLREKFDIIDDAYDAGGGGDPFPHLSPEEQNALIEATRMGFPPRSWFGYRTMGSHAFSALYGGLAAIDPDYFNKFWTEAGYLGADPDASIHRDRLQWNVEVAELIRGAADQTTHGPRGGVDQAFRGAAGRLDQIIAVRLSFSAPINSENAELSVTSGAAAGVRIALSNVTGDLATIDTPEAGRPLEALQAGDTVTIDNSNFLAAQTYHRHQVPAAEYVVWDQYRNPDGSPKFPQRPYLVGPILTRGASGVLQTGKFEGKMIVVACLLDREAFPWQADWYATKVREHLGDQIDDRFRLWYIDHGLHGDSGKEEEHPTRSVPYIGALHEALRQLVAWVENGEAPAASTSYQVADGQVIVPDTAAERCGVQPVAILTANSRIRAEVSPGDAVILRLTADTPPRAGEIVAIEWDLDGDGTFDAEDTVPPAEQFGLTRTVRFNEPGTYFVTARVTAQGKGNPDSLWARVENLARTRIVVT